MRPERWQQISTVFQAALARGPAERAAFLREACADDDSLRREVEALLSSYGRADDFIEQPAAEVAARLGAGEEAESVIGQALGPYKILRQLGAGGMGEV